MWSRWSLVFKIHGLEMEYGRYRAACMACLELRWVIGILAVLSLDTARYLRQSQSWPRIQAQVYNRYYIHSWAFTISRLAIVLYERRWPERLRGGVAYLHRFVSVLSRLLINLHNEREGMEGVGCALLKRKCVMIALLYPAQSAISTSLRFRGQLIIAMASAAVVLQTLLSPKHSFCSTLEVACGGDATILQFIRSYVIVLDGFSMVGWGGRLLDPPSSRHAECTEAMVTLFINAGVLLPLATAYLLERAHRRRFLAVKGYPEHIMPCLGLGASDIIVSSCVLQALVLQTVSLAMKAGGYNFSV